MRRDVCALRCLRPDPSGQLQQSVVAAMEAAGIPRRRNRGATRSSRVLRKLCAASLVIVLLAGTTAAKKPRAAKSSTPAPPRQHGLVYTVDDAHSFVEFSVRLLGFNRVRGAFPNYEAHVYYDSSAVTRSAVSMRIAVAGVSTHEPERDHHLESADFFDAAKFPYMLFESRQVVADATGFVALGDLTIRDVTRSIAVPFLITSPLSVAPFGNPRFSVTGHVTLSRSEYGVLGPAFWNKAIGDSVEIEFEFGARRWNYDHLGWANSKGRSIGEFILGAADSVGMDRALKASRDLWAKRQSEPPWNFGLFEYMKCAGRLGQRGRPGEGAAVLGQVIELRAASTAASDLAAIRCQRAELLLLAGQGQAAHEELARAIAADSTSTHVRALRHAIE